MKSFIAFSNCSDVTSIEDVNNKFSYFDEYPNGKGDDTEIACGQNGSYNELKHFFTKWLQPHIEKGTFSKDQVIEAICCACYEIKPPRKFDQFKGYLESVLKISI